MGEFKLDVLNETLHQQGVLPPTWAFKSPGWAVADPRPFLVNCETGAWVMPIPGIPWDLYRCWDMQDAGSATKLAVIVRKIAEWAPEYTGVEKPEEPQVSEEETAQPWPIALVDGRQIDDFEQVWQALMDLGYGVVDLSLRLSAPVADPIRFVFPPTHQDKK